MEKAKINSVFKTLDNTSKDNYRPVSTLSSFTKIFESTFSYNKIAIWITSSQNILWSKHSQNTLNNDIKVGATIIGVNTGNHR